MANNTRELVRFMKDIFQCELGESPEEAKKSADAILASYAQVTNQSILNFTEAHLDTLRSRFIEEIQNGALKANGDKSEIVRSLGLKIMKK